MILLRTFLLLFCILPVLCLDPEGQSILKWYQTSEIASSQLPSCYQLFVNRYYPRDETYAVNRFDKISYDSLRFSSDITYASEQPGAVPASNAVAFVNSGQKLIDLDQTSGCGYSYTSCDRVGVMSVLFSIRLYSVWIGRVQYREQFTVDEGKDKYAKCAWCMNPFCTPKTCDDGQYVTVAAIDMSPFILNRPVCMPCEAGTWNTCATKDSCKWNIPTQNVQRESLGADIYKFQSQTLIGSCYPCNLIHPNMYYSYGQYIVKTNEFYCPARIPNWVLFPNENMMRDLSPKAFPVDCPTNKVHNPSYTECVCRAGYYEGPTGCLPCQPGTYCVNGVQNRCQDHYRQENSGASDCIACTNKGGDPFANPTTFCGAGTYMQQCLEGNQGRAYCISCNQCIERYAHPIVSSTAVQCYT